MAKKEKVTAGQAYWKKFLFAAPVMAAACITLIFFGPYESLAFAGNAMRYDHRDIWLPLALISLGVFLLGTALLPLLKGRWFRYIVTGIFGLTLCGYLQSLLMNGSMGLLDGHTYKLNPGAAVFNTLIWIFLLLGCFVVLQLNRPWWRHLLRFGSLLLAIMQLTSIASIALGNHNRNTQLGHICLTESGIYEFSQGQNIFVFVLDRLDYSYIQSVMAVDPDFFQDLDGFTSYTNAISAYSRTQPALNHLLTGSESAYFTTKNDFFRESWNEDGKNLLADLSDLGFSTEIYTNLAYLFSDADQVMQYVDNAAPTAQVDLSVAVPRLLQLSALRWSPDLCKPLLYTDTNAYNEGVLQPSEYPVYEFNDSYYAYYLGESTADRNQKNFKFYHFHGSHAPYHLDADGNYSEEETNVTTQTIGSFNNLYYIFDRMKALGIYEDATIIITADHGYAYKDSQPVQRPVTIGLFYKPAGSAGEPLKESSAPVCTDNISATIMKQAGLADYSAYGPALDDIAEDAEIPRYYYKSVCETQTWHEVELHVYEILGDAKNFANWKEIEIYDIPAENRFY